MDWLERRRILRSLSSLNNAEMIPPFSNVTMPEKEETFIHGEVAKWANLGTVKRLSPVCLKIEKAIHIK